MKLGFLVSPPDVWEPALPAWCKQKQNRTLPSWDEVRLFAFVTRCLGAGTAGLVQLIQIKTKLHPRGMKLVFRCRHPIFGSRHCRPGAPDRGRTCTLAHWILNPACLPIPPQERMGHKKHHYCITSPGECQGSCAAIFSPSSCKIRVSGL